MALLFFLLVSLSSALAQVGITVQMFKKSDCSDKPTAQGFASTPLSDKETLGGKTHPADMCISKFGSGISFMGSCPSNTTTTMQYFDLKTSKLEQDGLRYCYMANGKCSGACVSSAVFSTVKKLAVPLCLTCQQMFGGSCANGVKAVKVMCGDHTPPPANTAVLVAAIAGGIVGFVLLLFCLKKYDDKKKAAAAPTFKEGQTNASV